MEILVDDVQDSIDADATEALADTAYPLRMGMRGNQIHAEVDLDGELDEVGLWTAWLTDAEGTWLYNNGDGRAYSELDAFIPTATTIF